MGRSQLTEPEHRALGIQEIHALTDMTAADPSRDPELSRALIATAGRQLGQLVADDHDLTATGRHI